VSTRDPASTRDGAPRRAKADAPARAKAPARPRVRGRSAREGRDERTDQSEAGLIYPAPDLHGPKVLAALVWAAGTIVAVLIGPIALSWWLAPVAAAAAAQATRTWNRRPQSKPLPAAAFVGAGFTVLCAAFGVAALVAGAVLAMVFTAAWATTAATRDAGDAASGVDVLLTVVCAAVPAAAAVAPVELRAHGLVAALVLVTYALTFDVAAWVMGSGSRHRWIGPLAGMICIASLSVGFGSIFPQFHGDSAWKLGALAVVLAPIGPGAASLVLGDRRKRVPALRRLDVLVVLGPVWAIAASALHV